MRQLTLVFMLRDVRKLAPRGTYVYLFNIFTALGPDLLRRLHYCALLCIRCTYWTLQQASACGV